MDALGNNDEKDIEEFLTNKDPEPVEKQSKIKVNPVGFSFYGPTFIRFNKLDEIRDLIPAFKSFYYQEKIKDPGATGGDIARRFNEEFCLPSGRTFYPYITNVKQWRAKWDLDMRNQVVENGAVIKKRDVYQVIKTRNEDNRMMGIPDDASIEEGTRTLAGELMNDALQMLRDDQELDEIYTSDELIKRRNYITNVFGHVTKMTHGKATLLLKASQEKRENASFLMNLLAKATSGNLTEEEMTSLKTTYSAPVVEQTNA